jgi:hypothetical protein
VWRSEEKAPDPSFEMRVVAADGHDDLRSFRYVSHDEAIPARVNGRASWCDTWRRAHSCRNQRAIEPPYLDKKGNVIGFTLA